MLMLELMQMYLSMYMQLSGEPLGERSSKASALIECKTPQQIEALRTCCTVINSLVHVLSICYALSRTMYYVAIILFLRTHTHTLM